MTKHDWKVGDRARIAYVDCSDIARGITVGEIVTIRQKDSNIPNCELTNGSMWAFKIDQLEPIPAETPKDPFAPGEYVTCVEKRADSSSYSKIGCTELVDEFKHHTDGWFCALGVSSYSGEIEPLGHRKRDFRPAIPEEIAAYKAKYEAEPVVDPQPKTYTLTPYIKPETIMFDGVEYLVTENV